MSHSGLKAPLPAGSRASNPGSDGDSTKKPKFDKDFIVLSEFSEQVGPVPLVSLYTTNNESCMKFCTSVLLSFILESSVWSRFSRVYWNGWKHCGVLGENPPYSTLFFVDKLSSYTVSDPGPVPLNLYVFTLTIITIHYSQETYPDEKARGSFDTNHFSVRIMSSDFQSSSG